MPPLRRQHHLRSALEAFLRQRDLEAAYRALTLGGWMAHYFQSRGPRQEAALKTHVRAPFPPPSPQPTCPHYFRLLCLSRALFPVGQAPCSPGFMPAAQPPRPPDFLAVGGPSEMESNLFI